MTDPTSRVRVITGETPAGGKTLEIVAENLSEDLLLAIVVAVRDTCPDRLKFDLGRRPDPFRLTTLSNTRVH